MKTRRFAIVLSTLAAVLVTVTNTFAQASNPRFGGWKLESTAPPPSSNVMTYEPYGDDGMRITVESTNARGQHSKWSYVTLFDGAFRPVMGQEGAETAVEMSTKILLGSRMRGVDVSTR